MLTYRTLLENALLGDADAGIQGGWIFPDGGFYRLNRRDGDTHNEVALRNLMGQPGFSEEDDATASALELGWIRVCWSPGREFGAEWEDGQPGRSAWRGLRNLIEDEDEFPRYILGDDWNISSRSSALRVVNSKS